MLGALLRSRKFWLTVIAVLQTVLLQYFGVSQELWQAINTLLMALVGFIAVEDAAQKFRG